LTSLPQDYLTVFVVAFLAVWLILLPVTVRQTLSRWSRLVDQYPDQAEEPLLRLRCNVSTRRRGPVDLHGTLILSACPSGLRVGRRRVFGRWYRDFFMPWERLSVVRQSTILPIAILQFGNPVSATIYLPGYVANRLARAAENRWPETGPFPEERGAYVRRVLVLLVAVICALFFIMALQIAVASVTKPSILRTILILILPLALFYGAALVVNYLFKKS
jgi:hypothetical protein